VVDDLGHLFNDHPNFHLALTFRNNKEQPLNSGFIAVRGTADAILRYLVCSFFLLFLLFPFDCDEDKQTDLEYFRLFSGQCS
jgi:hypothetical protein